MPNGWETVIGLEIHAQLSTESKIFCGCSTRFGDEPNSNTCPVCLGLPGALPVLNRRAVELGARAALALGLRINERSIFARKNYFYPDLPKGYQISQYDQPLAEHGFVDVIAEDAGGIVKRIGVTRVHMEDDAGKRIHDGFKDSDRYTYVDLNRSGTPLIETVSMRSKEHAHDYRYFPEPDLVPLRISDDRQERVRMQMPELPASRRKRFIGDYGLREYDAEVLTSTRAMSEYFEKVVAASGDARAAANWVMGELAGTLKEVGREIEDSPISAENLGRLIALIAQG